MNIGFRSASEYSTSRYFFFWKKPRMKGKMGASCSGTELESKSK
jgi:hypothetical protein